MLLNRLNTKIINVIPHLMRNPVWLLCNIVYKWIPRLQFIGQAAFTRLCGQAEMTLFTI
jgi:hypothetical protein